MVSTQRSRPERFQVPAYSRVGGSVSYLFSLVDGGKDDRDGGRRASDGILAPSARRGGGVNLVKFGP